MDSTKNSLYKNLQVTIWCVDLLNKKLVEFNTLNSVLWGYIRRMVKYDAAATIKVLEENIKAVFRWKHGKGFHSKIEGYFKNITVCTSY